MTTRDIEGIRKEIAEVSEFVKEHVSPLAEERARLHEAVSGLAEASREVRRRSLAGADSPPDRRVAQDGPYAGCDALDLAIVRSLHRAAQYSQGETPAVQEWGTRLKAAMDSVTGGSGSELVPQAEASALWRDVNLETVVASMFSRISMPTSPFDIPLQLGDVNWYPGTENTATTQTALSTAKQTLTAQELVAEVPWSLTLEEDAVIAMLPEVRRTLARNAAEVIDDVLLNGDTTTTNNINADGTTISTSDAGKAHWLVGFDGLLHLPLVDNTAQKNSVAGAIGAGVYNEALRMVGKYGVRPAESPFITDVNTFLASLAMDEVETADKAGGRGTMLSGQLGVVYGHPLVVSEQMRLADTDGKVTDGGNGTDTGRVLVVNRGQWRVGFRRELTIETERDIQKRQNVMVVSMRLAFDERTGSRGSATHTALQYNITGVA